MKKTLLFRGPTTGFTSANSTRSTELESGHGSAWGENMKLLCKLGLHSWEFKGFTNLLLSDTLRICRRCGAGRHDILFGQASAKLSATEVHELRVAGKIQ